MITWKKVTASVLLIGLASTSISCSGSKQSVEKDPCETESSELIAKTKALKEEASSETLRGIRYHTKRKVVLMPVISKSGGGMPGMPMAYGGGSGDMSEFATEIMNQSFRNEGIKTVAWFKVSKKLKEVLGISNNNQQQMQAYNPYGGMQQSLVNDENLNELIEASKELGACYVVRPVILKSSNTSNTKTSYSPVGLAFGFGGGRTKTTSNAEIDIKIDIISTREEDIIASKTFSGRSAQVSKKRANVLDGITGSSIFGGGSQTNQSKIAFYDTIDKIVEFLEDKMI